MVLDTCQIGGNSHRREIRKHIRANLKEIEQVKSNRGNYSSDPRQTAEIH